MADLLDIVPATAVEYVYVTGGRVIVRGLRVHAMASIISRFPRLATLFVGGANLDAKLIGELGFVFAPIIAAGLDPGHLGEEKYEKAAEQLLIEDQVKLVKAILGLTFPNGLNSFVETMMALASSADEGEKIVKMRLKKSPSPLPPSSDADFPPTMQ